MNGMQFAGRAMPRRKFLEYGLKSGLAITLAPPFLSHLMSCSGRKLEHGPGMDLEKECLDRVIKKALSQGGDFADVYIESRISRQIVMEESVFRSGLYGISQGAGVRVISGNKTGYAYTEEVTEENLMRAAEVASYVARNSKSVVPVNIAKADRESFIKVVQPLEAIADIERIEVMERANQAALDYDPRIKMA